MLIDTFINAIFLYDDKLVITFNYKEGTKTITFADLQDAINNKTGADLDCCGAPRRNEFCSFRFFMGNALPLFAPACLLPAFYGFRACAPWAVGIFWARFLLHLSGPCLACGGLPLRSTMTRHKGPLIRLFFANFFAKYCPNVDKAIG